MGRSAFFLPLDGYDELTPFSFFSVHLFCRGFSAAVLMSTKGGCTATVSDLCEAFSVSLCMRQLADGDCFFFGLFVYRLSVSWLVSVYYDYFFFRKV